MRNNEARSLRSISHYLVAAIALGVVGPAMAETTATTAQAVTTTMTKSDAGTSVAQTAAMQKLVGRWVRPDGGYVLEVRSVDGAGRVDAGYFNPGSINVGKANASQAGGTVELYVELRDVNYPGSNYKLKYDPATDKLHGPYYQAVAGETYPIWFEREKK